MPQEKDREIEIRIVIGTDMIDELLDLFIEDLETEITEQHLVPPEKVLGALWTEKISYEARRAVNER